MHARAPLNSFDAGILAPILYYTNVWYSAYMPYVPQPLRSLPN